VHLPPAGLNRQLYAGRVLGWASVAPEQERSVNLLDMAPGVLDPMP